jgi:hypothetical protein
MFGLGKQEDQPDARVSPRLCTNRFNGKYPHVGLYDCRMRQVWVCRPLAGRAIRTSHARLITGSKNAISTAWKDRFLCYWFYTPRTGDGYVHGYPIDWEEAHLLVRTDPSWDYDRQKIIPAEMEDHMNENLERQYRHAEHILEFYRACKLKYPLSLHFVGERATESQFYVRRIEAHTDPVI